MKMLRRYIVLIYMGMLGAATLAARRPTYGQQNLDLIDQKNFKMNVGKLILDVDVGADDATAILMALGHDEGYSLDRLQVLAITCVHGNADIDNVVRNVLVTLHVAQRLDVPVYKGAESSIHTTPPPDHFFGKNGFGDFIYRNAPDPNKFLQKKHAVNALIDLVSESPGEVTVLALGPLTNIALAIRLDPLFLTKVRRLVVLGGSVEGIGNVRPGLEFNFYKDPEAAFIVFNATDTRNPKIKPIVLYPWETVEKRSAISLEWRRNVLGTIDSPHVRLLNLAERVSAGNSTAWNTADTLATAVVVNSSIVTAWSRHYALVETQGRVAGVIVVDYHNTLRESPNVVLIQQIDMEMFKDMLLKKLV